MTTIRDAKQWIADIADDLLQDPEGATWSRLYDQFKLEHGSHLDEIGAELADDWLRRICNERIKRASRQRSEQLTLPGIGKIDAFVTIPDGEGGFRVKRFQYATLAELDADEIIQDQNVDSAVRARDHVVRRNEMVRPIMQRFGFTVAGEAIDWLNQGGAG